jgi:hypothetical protein
MVALMLSMAALASVPIALEAEPQCCGKKAKARKEAKADPFSDFNLQRYTREIVPILEEVSGRTFQPVPEVVWVDPESLSKSIALETLEIFESVFPGLQQESLESLAQGAQMQLGGLLGKYTPGDQVVHVNDKAVQMVGDELSLSEDDLVDVTKLVLAHELVHALQDQASPVMDALSGAANEDQFHAIRAVEEGQATLVERRVAEHMGLEEAYGVMCRLQGWSGETLVDKEAFDVWAVYGLGMTFVEQLEEVHGNDWVWTTLLASPPARTGMLFRPETYDIDAEPSTLVANFDGVSEALTKNREWNEVRSPLPEMELWKEALFADEDQLREVLGHIETADRLKAYLPGRDAGVRVLRFDGPDGVQAFLELLEAEETGLSAERAKAMGLPVEIDIRPLDVEGDNSFLRVETYVNGFSRGPGQERELYVVSRENVVVLLSVFGFRPGLRANRAIERVFDNL